MSDFKLPPPDVEFSHAQKAALPILCPGCQQEIKDTDQIRTMFISVWGAPLIVHNKVECIRGVGPRMPSKEIRQELGRQAFWLCTEIQRELRNLS